MSKSFTESTEQAGRVPALDAAQASRAEAAVQALLERREHVLGAPYRLFYDHPVYLTRGEGVWLYDNAGRAYLDAYNNVPVVGHCHPKVVAALAGQAAVLNTHTRYLHETVVDYAQALLATFPSELNRAMFTCTGSESNDLALRLARRFTGGTGIIVSRYAYHGGTTATAELSPALGASYQLPAHVRLVAAPDSYRGGPDAGQRFVADIERALQDMQAHGIKPAALLFDTLFSSDGLFADPPGCLSQAADVIRRAGGVFIADEVQAGFGRSGSHFWGFARHQVIPDIVTMGKPMGNGHPLAGLVARSDILDVFGQDCRYFNTFGGNPVSAAVGLAVLNVIHDGNLRRNAQRVGGSLRGVFREMAGRYRAIGDVRGAGLFTALEIVKPGEDNAPDGALAKQVMNDMRERGVLISVSGPHANVLKIRPPLVFSEEDAKVLVRALEASLAQYA
ncbi:MOSC domain-containing protein OS=Castellaniella defragrans OX=75697 GN=HNR28_000169 PE=3 SV=1 [Castellaniella defragrans]